MVHSRILVGSVILKFLCPCNEESGGVLNYPCLSVRPPRYRYMVCPAISSYSFGATALIFCRIFIHIMEVGMSTGFWFSSNILKMTGRWKGFSCWSIWGGPLREWNETWYLCSYHQCWYFDVDRKWPTVGHDLHRNSMGNSFICFRTTEQTLTIFDRNFPNKVWNSSHMTSNILMADQPKHRRTVVHDL